MLLAAVLKKVYARCKKVAKSFGGLKNFCNFAAKILFKLFLELEKLMFNQKKNCMMKVKKIEVKMEQKGLSMEINKQEFALALKTWRLRNDLTQKKVAEMWGCSRFTIMRAELAKDITWEMAYRLFAKLSEELRKESSHEVHDNH